MIELFLLLKNRIWEKWINKQSLYFTGKSEKSIPLSKREFDQVLVIFTFCCSRAEFDFLWTKNGIELKKKSKIQPWKSKIWAWARLLPKKKQKNHRNLYKSLNNVHRLLIICRQTIIKFSEKKIISANNIKRCGRDSNPRNLCSKELIGNRPERCPCIYKARYKFTKQRVEKESMNARYQKNIRT